jgi:AcrR family transcriptional regulator
MTTPSPVRPSGRDEIRASVLDAAERHFAAHGTKASLRDIAAEAQVNLGLIHRHFGNKDDLLRAVLERQTTAGVGVVEAAPDAAQAVRRIFEMSEGSAYIRTLAWMLLADEQPERFQEHYPTIRALQEKAGDDHDAGLLAAFAAIYGWTVFGDQLLNAFGRTAADKPALRRRLAEIVGSLANR